jgi:peptidoglycan hydrolase CwlO-like protein
MKNKKYFPFFLLIIIISFAFMPFLKSVNADQLQNAQDDKARLEAELASLEKEIAAKQKQLEAQKGQSTSISRDIAILTSQIEKSKLDIKSKNLTIKKLGGEINQKNKTIQSLSIKIENEKESLAQMIRKEREIEELPLLALILSKESISDVYGDIDSFSSIKKGIQDSVDEIRGIKRNTEVEKKTLEQKKNAETDAKMEIENSKKKVELSEAEKKNLRDTAAIPFSKALEYANLASKKTDIRPAFLLAILTQESNLGANVGSCYLSNPTTGAGVGAKSGKAFPNVMKPTRDVQPFLTITSELGRDPYKTLVSCPIAGVGGYGGAMGPSQFIPSTWQIIRGRVATALGTKTADPWNPRDAFMASAIYLTDLGAGVQTYTAERNAACRYYSGSICPSSGKDKKDNTYTELYQGKYYSKREYSIISYGNGVLSKATNIQTNMIDPLQD